MIDIQPTVQVIDLMAESARHEAFSPELALLAVAVEVFHSRALRSRNDFGKIGNRQASFIVGDLPFRLHHLGVDEDASLTGPLADGEVDDHEPLGDADLVRSEADTR